MPYPAAGAVACHPPHHHWPAWPATSDTWERGPPALDPYPAAGAAAAAVAGHPPRHGWPAWPVSDDSSSSSAWERGPGAPVPYPAAAWERGPVAPVPYPASTGAGAGHPPRPACPPRRGDSSSAWDRPPRALLPAPPESAATARHPPLHDGHLWTAAGGEGDSSAWDKGEWQPLSPVPADPIAPEYFDKLAGYFVEAASRLPLADIPYLTRCLTHSGLAIGFADPVTNIIITTIDAFAHTPHYLICPEDGAAIEQTQRKITFAEGARCSWEALNLFMLRYFRNLTPPQSEFLLCMAEYDLRVAVEAVQLYVGGRNHPDLLLHDSARTKAALMAAAYPPCTAPELLRLMTSTYPCSLVQPVLEILSQGGKLTVACVDKVCQMLRGTWTPPPSRPPPVGTFRDSSGGITMTVCFGPDLFVTTRVSMDGATSAAITRPPQTYAGSSDTTNMLGMFPLNHGRLVISHSCSLAFEDPEFLPFLKFQLLDMLHVVYLKAIALLPVGALRKGHLLRSLLAAGHCYGPLDPVANIIMNTAWFDALYPLSRDVASKIGAADILDARSMHRIESRSIDGLVAYLCRSPTTDEQDAVALLCKHQLDIPISELSNMCDVALAAKHPEPAAFGAFLECVPIQRLYNFYSQFRVSGNPDVAFEGLQMALFQETTSNAEVRRRAMDRSAALERLNIMPRPKIDLATLSAKRSTFVSNQAALRRVLEELLRCYGYSEPMVPPYKLGVICGVTRKRNFTCTDVYHANFLASSDDGCSWKLFFAEFWNQPDHRVEESKNPFCCPILDYHQYPGRCVVCESDSSIILHPQSRKYYMGNSSFPIPGHFGVGTSDILDVDVIYSSLVKEYATDLWPGGIQSASCVC